MKQVSDALGVILFSLLSIGVVVFSVFQLAQNPALRPDASLLRGGYMLTPPLSAEASSEMETRFQQAVAMLHAKRYDYAVMALERVIEINPNIPEVWVNLGYALMGLERNDEALGYFERALELHDRQANAYYGMALVFEAKQDYEMALGAMRSYIHFSTPEDPYLVKARSALWEWEAKLGRIPDGSKDMPPGGLKMPGHAPAKAK